MPPGRKNKGECPSDIHLRLSDDLRDMVDSIGSGRYQDKIIESIKHCAQKNYPETLTDIQSRILDLKRQRNALNAQLKEAIEKLQHNYELPPEEFDLVIERIEIEAQR